MVDGSLAAVIAPREVLEGEKAPGVAFQRHFFKGRDVEGLCGEDGMIFHVGMDPNKEGDTLMYPLRSSIDNERRLFLGGGRSFRALLVLGFHLGSQSFLKSFKIHPLLLLEVVDAPGGLPLTDAHVDELISSREDDESGETKGDQITFRVGDEKTDDDS